MTLESSIILYVLVIALSLYLFKRRKKLCAFLAVMIIWLLSSLRWDIGNDYENYYLISRELSSFQSFYSQWYDSGSYVEPFYQLVNFIFKPCKYSCIGVMSIFSGLTLILWYKTLRNINGVFGGFFFFFTMFFFFKGWDQVRQFLAISIIAYSYRYISTRQIYKYFVCVLLAINVHFSAIVCLPIYFFNRIKPKPVFYIITLGILLAGWFTGIWEQFFMAIISLAGPYASYINVISKLTSGEYGTGLGFLFQFIVYSGIMLKIVKVAPTIANMIFIGICIFTFATGNELIARVSDYYLGFSIIGFPLAIKGLKKGKLGLLVKIIVTLLLLAYCTYNLYKGVNGVTPYDSYLFDDFKGQFRIREYNQ